MEVITVRLEMITKPGDFTPIAWDGIVDVWGSEVLRLRIPHDRFDDEQMRELIQKEFAKRLRRALRSQLHGA